MTAEPSSERPSWSRYLDATWWRNALPALSIMAPPRWLRAGAANEDAVELSGVFERPVPVPQAALLVLRAGLVALLLGRIGWLLIPASLALADAPPAQLERMVRAPVVELLGHSLLTWLLAAFYAVCAILVARVRHGAALSRAHARRARLHDPLLVLCGGVLFWSGSVVGSPVASSFVSAQDVLSARGIERFVTALLPMVWVLTRRSLQLRSRALGLARLGVALGFVAHALLFFDWTRELPLLGRLLVSDLALGNRLTDVIMSGLCVLYAGLGLAIALGAWLRRLDRVLLGAAVTLGAFTAGIRICLGLEPGFFQASAAHWLLSTLLGAAVGSLPLFMALCADQRLVALGAEPSVAFASQSSRTRRPGPLSAA
jgi:hypothetical protein